MQQCCTSGHQTCEVAEEAFAGTTVDEGGAHGRGRFTACSSASALRSQLNTHEELPAVCAQHLSVFVHAIFRRWHLPAAYGACSAVLHQHYICMIAIVTPQTLYKCRVDCGHYACCTQTLTMHGQQRLYRRARRKHAGNAQRSTSESKESKASSALLDEQNRTVIGLMARQVHSIASVSP